MNRNNEQIAQETWVSIGKSIRKEYFISDRGHIKTIDLRNGEVKFSCGSLNKHTGYVSFNGPHGNEYVHRAVAKAFCVQPSPEENEVNHIDHNRQNNTKENLEWTTPSANRSDHIASRKRSINRRSTSHKGECIQATNWVGETKFFKNGMAAAKHFQCSHVLVYNSLNGRLSARKCRGWKLRWVPFTNQVLEDVGGAI